MFLLFLILWLSFYFFLSFWTKNKKKINLKFNSKKKLKEPFRSQSQLTLSDLDSTASSSGSRPVPMPHFKHLLASLQVRWDVRGSQNICLSMFNVSFIFLLIWECLQTIII